VSLYVPRAPADERKMHFCAARGGSLGARGRARNPAERLRAQLVNLVVCRILLNQSFQKNRKSCILGKDNIAFQSIAKY